MSFLPQSARTALTWLPVFVLVSDQVATVHIVRDEQPKLMLISRRVRASTLRTGQIVAVYTPDGKQFRINKIGALHGENIPHGFIQLIGEKEQEDDFFNVPVAMVAGRVVRQVCLANDGKKI